MPRNRRMRPRQPPLLTLDNLVVTPRIGSAALPTRLNTLKLGARNLMAGLQGQAMAACANPGALE